jgi:predicted permease
MALLSSFIAGIKALFSRERQRAQLDEELESYVEAAAQDKEGIGLPRAEALRRARAEMGSRESVKTKVSAAGWETAIESVAWDLRYAVRQLLRTPGFTVVALIILALGIGANTAVFTLVHGVMLKQLPIANPSQLYRVGEGEYYCCEWGGLETDWGTFDYPFYKHLRDSDGSFSQLAAFSGSAPSYTVRRQEQGASAHTIDGEYVSGNYFSTLGVEAVAGRAITAFDDNETAGPVAVLSYRTWQNQFGGDPSMVGARLLINEIPVTVIGIAPAGFYGDRLTANPPGIWMPLSMEAAFEGNGRKSLYYSSGDAWLYVVGRLAPGAHPAAVQARLTTELQQWLRSERTLSQEDLAALPRQRVALTAGGTGVSSFRSSYKRGLVLLALASLLVQLIACANLANLLLARGAARRQQTALCLSLGASRLRLMRATLTESLLLALAGGALGVLAAYGLARAVLLVVFRGYTFVPISAAPSLPVLGFAFLLALLTTVAFAAAPAWIATRGEPGERLMSGNRAVRGQASGLQRALVVLQAAVSVVLLAVAGLVSQSLIHLENADLGFQPAGRLTAAINFKAAGYTPERLPALYEQIQDRLEQLPGVRSASLSLNAPQLYCCVSVDIVIAGRSEKWIEDADVLLTRVTPQYFETVGTPLLEGRAFSRSDTQNAPHVAVVDQNFARLFFAGKNPIGQHFGLSGSSSGADYEIVGVAGNTKFRDPESKQNPVFFVPFSQTTAYGPSGYQRFESGTHYAQVIEMNVNGEPTAYADMLRKALAEIDPNLTPVRIDAYSERVATQFNEQRLIARLTVLFGVLALLLASVGLYGVTAYNVARRTAEIGIRMALGANRASVLRMVLAGALGQAAVGLAIGVPLAVLCGRLLAHQLYEVSLFDPSVLGGSVVVLAACALLAGVVPARRAASVDPNQALRTE